MIVRSDQGDVFEEQVAFELSLAQTRLLFLGKQLDIWRQKDSPSRFWITPPLTKLTRLISKGRNETAWLPPPTTSNAWDQTALPQIGKPDSLNLSCLNLS